MRFITFGGSFGFEFLDHIAIGKGNGGYLLFTPNRDLESFGERIGDRYAHAMQTT